MWNILIKFYRCIEYYKLHILVFSYLPLMYVNEKISFGQSSFMEYLNKILRYKEYLEVTVT